MYMKRTRAKASMEEEELLKKQKAQNPNNGLAELLWMAAIATCVKLLLVPAYHSTDFEVHRHWLALTHSLPVKQWYSDETSPWTLDYPPFFAWFEKLLAIFGSMVDPKMVNLVDGLNYNAETVVVFQRATVMFADLMLYWALWRCCRNLPLEKQRLVYIAVVWSPSLFMVDHIHFQYNGFLLGILLLSLSLLSEGQDLMGGMVFAVLLCFKHLFAVAGPIYFVYLLRHYCRGPYKLLRFLVLGISVISVFLLAFGPFIYHGQCRFANPHCMTCSMSCPQHLWSHAGWGKIWMNPKIKSEDKIKCNRFCLQISQVLKRLFPFGRGLCHAYWAPNLWALYNTADKAIAFSLRRLGFNFQTSTASLTGGLVGDFSSYAVLPQITPIVTLMLVMLAMFPCIVQIWRHPQQQHVVRWVAYAYACGFMFGWHVHEKASLHFVIPLSLVAIVSLEDAGHYILLSTVSCYSMFPLLYEDKEYPVKVLLLAIQVAIMCRSFPLYMSNEDRREHLACDHLSPNKALPVLLSSLVTVFCMKGNVRRTELIGKVGQVYLWGLIVVEIWGYFVHPFLFNGKLPFLPLMLGSAYCTLGMIYSWVFQLSCIFLWT